MRGADGAWEVLESGVTVDEGPKRFAMFCVSLSGSVRAGYFVEKGVTLEQAPSCASVDRSNGF